MTSPCGPGRGKGASAGEGEEEGERRDCLGSSTSVVTYSSFFSQFCKETSVFQKRKKDLFLDVSI